MTSSTASAIVSAQIPATMPRDMPPPGRGRDGDVLVEQRHEGPFSAWSFATGVRVEGSVPGSAMIRATSVEREVMTRLKGG